MNKPKDITDETDIDYIAEGAGAEVKCKKCGTTFTVWTGDVDSCPGCGQKYMLVTRLFMLESRTPQ